ncbi:MAG TPA: ATP phosphoribosyltransferase [Bacteroidota bacterium]|nr:ATP phosphoribosyltransferase [Bacteroidota bacterium]
MLARNGRLKIAVQREGRIADDSVALLKHAGLDFDFRSRALFSPCRNFSLDILAVRDDDIPEFVQDGVSHLGVVGENLVRERGAQVSIVEHLGFGKCRLVICVPKGSPITELCHLSGKRIATSYPVSVRRFLAEHQMTAEVIEISGSVEIAPTLDVADATCDIVSTGSTARTNGLEILHTVMESEAVLIAATTALESPATMHEINNLLRRIRSQLKARGKRYVMMNAPAAAVEKITSLTPGMKSPTIMPLATSGMVAIHSVVGEDVFWEVMDQLKRAGATDIVVLPIEKFIP